ncbi:CD48 antigen-like isoform X5 [Cygnus olor]|uniref:CD48 antigen-like isoform X5 n=1 Tax=Cygnus olor TaxID=8869 RepID=UPI001ADE7003|nr:CD48 antigen-like isoform X5 [Cygnus olor]
MEVFVCLLLACLLRRAACAISTLEVDGAEGRSITFHLQGLKGENLAWSFRGETILTIKLGESPDPSFYEDSYKSRVTFPEDGSALTISQLGKKDAGTYTAKNSVFKASFFLRVYSVLQEPAVTCASWNCSADGCRYTLHCAVHTPGNKSFSWSHGEQLDAEGPEVVVEAPPLGELDVLSYTCTVRNPVSSSNATVSPAALCADSYRSSFTGTVAAMVIIALIILAVLLAFLIFRGRKICNPSMPGAPATGRIFRLPQAFPSFLDFLGEDRLVTKIRREFSHCQGLAPQHSHSHSPPKALTPPGHAGGRRPSSLEPR